MPWVTPVINRSTTVAAVAGAMKVLAKEHWKKQSEEVPAGWVEKERVKVLEIRMR